MGDQVAVRHWSCPNGSLILSLLHKEVGASKTRPLNLSIVVPLEEGEEKEERDNSSSLMVLN